MGIGEYWVGVPSGRKVGSVDSITCLVHRLGVTRPAEQAALEPGPALSTHQSGCWGRVPWPGRAGLCKPPDPAAHWSRWGLPIPPLLAYNCCRPHPVWVGPVPDVTMLYDRAAGAEDKSVGCIITMPPWSSLQHLVPVTTAMGPAGGGPGVRDTWPLGQDGIVCPVLASADGRCVGGTLGFHKNFL